ncbi:ABC transporter ATP-binding protein [[Mycoplasma] testudinis]|uniref:ABC transporter ATP-binding protein n=1 Tax=[Mycoplasma] testudinis TaxID=33924 RepID=UPI000483FE8B|nr:ABC transporter ATP-binding protein [[Mycoplasma] testudinis]
MFRLLRYLDPKYKWYVSVSLGFTFGSILTDLLIPSLFSALIPIIVQPAVGGPTSELGKVTFLLWEFNLGDQALGILAGSMVSAAILGIVFLATSAFMASKVAAQVAMLTRSNLFKKIQELSSGNLDKFGTASLGTRLTNDITQISTLMVLVLRIMIRAPFLFIGGLVFALLTNLYLSISIVVLVPVLLTIIFVAGFYAVPVFKANQKAVDNINVQSRESILGVRVIKSFNLEEVQKEKFKKSNINWTRYSTKAFRIMTALIPAVTLLANFGTVIVLILGHYAAPQVFGSVVDNRTDPANASNVSKISAFLQYQGYITMGLIMSVMISVNYVRTRVSVKRIFEVLDENPLIKMVKSDKNLKDASVVFENVEFKYHEHGEPALRNINLSILSGETVGIIGATGSGKSTLVSLIPRLYDVYSGRVMVGGVDVREADSVKLREQVGMVLQENVLFKGTIRSNLLFGKEDATEQEMQEALDLSCASNFVSKFSEGIDHPIEQRGKNLSGGQKQRTTIARALLRKPKILILDDSTSALDAITDQSVRDNIRTKLKGTTTIIVAQKVVSIKNADKIVVIDKGEIVRVGKHHELIETCPLYKEIALSQMSEEELANE